MFSLIILYTLIIDLIDIITFVEAEELLNEECLKSTSIHEKMEKLAKKMHGSRFKLRVDEDDILNDAIAYYKSPSFDPTRPLRIQFTGQPAVDTGGVKREFFTQLKEQFISGEHFSNFEGPANRLLFKYNQQCLVAGIPKTLGTIISHSLVQPVWRISASGTISLLLLGNWRCGEGFCIYLGVGCI